MVAAVAADPTFPAYAIYGAEVESTGAVGHANNEINTFVAGGGGSRSAARVVW